MTLSVHILTYNCERYIKDALDSVLHQKTTFSFEIVIGDDASSDDTFNIIENYAEKHKHIKAIQNKNNLGILKNFKATLDRCSGKYIFDLAGDDWLSDKHALQVLVDALEKNPNYSFVDSGFDSYYERSGKLKRFYNKKNMHMTKEKYRTYQKVYGNSFIGCCYRKDALYNIIDFTRYEQEGFEFEDYPILTDLVMNSDFGLIPKSMSVYRIHRKSHSNSASSYLKTKLFFAKKYDFSKAEIAEIHRIDHNHMLHNASLNGDKLSGKEHFYYFRKPMFINLIYFISSQNKIARRLFNFLRKI